MVWLENIKKVRATADSFSMKKERQILWYLTSEQGRDTHRKTHITRKNSDEGEAIQFPKYYVLPNRIISSSRLGEKQNSGLNTADFMSDLVLWSDLNETSRLKSGIPLTFFVFQVFEMICAILPISANEGTWRNFCIGLSPPYIGRQNLTSQNPEGKL